VKERELRESAVCGLCGKKIGENRAITFFRITLERFILDIAAIQRQTGLGMMLEGNGYLAQVMGPDEDLAKSFDDPIQITVCESCSIDHPLIWLVLEKVEKHLDEEEQKT